SSRRRHTRCLSDWSSDVCSSDLNAPPPQAGLITGAYGIVGTAKLPVGQVWVVGTNVGEWHLLTENGFYLARLFQSDPLKVKWPRSQERRVGKERRARGRGKPHKR